MSSGLRDKRIAFLVAPEGARPILISTAPGRIQAYNHLDHAETFDVDEVVDETAVEDFDGLVLPGGVANPDYLRMQSGAVDFVKESFGSEPSTLVSSRKPDDLPAFCAQLVAGSLNRLR